MKKLDIYIPEDIEYLSQWGDQFYSQLPAEKFILNKEVCGCGATEYFLENPTVPLILISPRRELINSKVNSKRLKALGVDLHYFDRSNPRKSVSDSLNELTVYITNCTEFDIVTQSYIHKCPKIIVTYDSFPTVLDRLSKLITPEELQSMLILVDEFTCLFSDVWFKGQTELKIINLLNSLSNQVIYISATPVSEEILDTVTEFKNLNMVNLIWDPRRKVKIDIIKQKMRTTKEAVEDIIKDFRKNGYFQSMMIENKMVYSTEAVFFLNSVNDIKNIISSLGLTPGETNIICAADKKNIEKLNTIGMTIGSLPKIGEPNKTFTFVTRASFEGADFYSDCSSTYVFSDANRQNLCLDISIDLFQIAGRCRTKTNPFRNSIQYYYKTVLDKDNVDFNKMKDDISLKIKLTRDQIDMLNSKPPDAAKNTLMSSLSKGLESEKYKESYMDIVEDIHGNKKAILNELAIAAERRALDIKATHFKTSLFLNAALDFYGFDSIDFHEQNQSCIQEYYKEFRTLTTFKDKVLLYIKVAKMGKEFKEAFDRIVEIPDYIKIAYLAIGEEGFQKAGYRKSVILNIIQNTPNNELITNLLKEVVKPDQFYKSSELKKILAKIYKRTKINRTTFSAADILNYFPNSIASRIRDDQNKQVRGFVIKFD